MPRGHISRPPIGRAGLTPGVTPLTPRGAPPLTRPTSPRRLLTPGVTWATKSTQNRVSGPVLGTPRNPPADPLSAGGTDDSAPGPLPPCFTVTTPKEV